MLALVCASRGDEAAGTQQIRQTPNSSWSMKREGCSADQEVDFP